MTDNAINDIINANITEKLRDRENDKTTKAKKKRRLKTVEKQVKKLSKAYDKLKVEKEYNNPFATYNQKVKIRVIATKKLDKLYDLKKEKKRLKNQISKKITFNFQNTVIKSSLETLAKRKDPAKYLLNYYKKKTEKQVQKLIEDGKYRQAYGVSKVAETYEINPFQILDKIDQKGIDISGVINEFESNYTAKLKYLLVITKSNDGGFNLINPS